MSTIVDKWKGGDNLVLVDGAARIASRHVGRPEDMVKEWISFFTNDVKKVEILRVCLEKMSGVSDRFKSERIAPVSNTKVPSLQQIAKELREAKRKFLESTLEQKVVTITVGTLLPDNYTAKDLQYLTPQKGLQHVARIPTNRATREALLAKLSTPVTSLEELTKEEKEEAEANRESYKKQAAVERNESWNDASPDLEYRSLTEYVQIAFRALLAENVKKLDVFRNHSGTGDIRWDFRVKDLENSKNEVLYRARAAYASKIMRSKEGDSLPPAVLMEVLETERVKYEWFVKMFTKEEEAKRLVMELEDSLGQTIQSSLLASQDTGLRVYVTLAADCDDVKNNVISLFAFYREKFSHLRAGELLDAKASKPTKSSIHKVIHTDDEAPLDESSMPDDVKEAYHRVFLHKPISKHPQGVPVKETQRQKESTSIDTVWQLKSDVDKLSKWAEKRNGKGPTKKLTFSDSDSEEVKTPPAKKHKDLKGKAKGKSESNAEILKLERRLSKLESKGHGEKRPRDDDHRRPPAVCYDFRDRGKCSRGDRCRFSHERRDDSRRGEPSRDRDRGRERERDKSRERRPHIKVPDGACENLKKGRCDTKGCAALHGKFNKTSKKDCWSEKEGRLCYNLFGEEGCHFFHSDEYAKN